VSDALNSVKRTRLHLNNTTTIELDNSSSLINDSHIRKGQSPFTSRETRNYQTLTMQA